MKRASLIILFFIILAPILAQETNVLDLKHKRFFKERDVFTKDTSIYILCEVCYNDPRSIDEEYCRSISFQIKDTLKFKNVKKLDLEKDTAILTYTYNRLSVWNWNDIRNSIKGTIEIISISEDEIELKLDIIVSEREKYLYKGIRSFKRTKSVF